MTSTRRLLLPAAILLFPLLLAAQPAYEYIGPNGGRTASLSMTDNGTLFIQISPDRASPARLYRMRTGEQQWSPVPAIDPATAAGREHRWFTVFGSVIIAFDGEGAGYRSLDEGETWERISGLPEGDFSFDRGDSLFVRVGQTLYLSVDTARTWERFFKEDGAYVLGISDRGTYLNVPSSDARHTSDLVRRESDGRLVTITPSDGFLQDYIIRGDRLLVSYRDSDTSERQFYRSTDGGDTWTISDLPTRGTMTYDGNRIWSIDEEGIYWTSFAGNTWVPSVRTGLYCPMMHRELREQSFLIVRSDTIHLATTQGYYRALPNAGALRPMVDGIERSTHIQRLDLIGDTLVATTPYGSYVTGDHAGHSTPNRWQARKGPPAAYAPVSTRIGDRLFTFGRLEELFSDVNRTWIYRSSDLGLSWDSIDVFTGEFGEDAYSMWSIGDLLVNIARVREGFYLSDDYGATWDLRTFGGHEVALMVGNNDTIICSVQEPTGTDPYMIRSFDRGLTWEITNVPANKDRWIRMTWESGSLYKLPEGATKSFARSDDVCETWQPLRPISTNRGGREMVAKSAVLARGDTLILAGFVEGDNAETALIVSFDRGASWRDLPLPPDTVRSLALDGQTLYVGTGNRGVYRLDIGSVLSAPDEGVDGTIARITRRGADRLAADLAQPGHYTISFTTLDGRRAATLDLGRRSAGDVEIEIPELASGYYLWVLQREGVAVADGAGVVE